MNFWEHGNISITMKYLLLVLCAGLVALPGCSSFGSQPAGGEDLTGKVWALSELLGMPPVTGTFVSAQFSADGKVFGSAGCNQYSGSYTVTGSRISISSQPAVTLMMCEPQVMTQESAYLKALGEVETFAVHGDGLSLAGAGGKTLLVFKAQSQDLSSSSWEVVNFNNGKQAVISTLAGASMTASFGTDGQVTGNAGCNTYRGTYKSTGNQISIGPLSSTRMFCAEPEGVMEQEAQYLAALQSAATYKLEGNTLEMRTQDDALAVILHRK